MNCIPNPRTSTLELLEDFSDSDNTPCKRTYCEAALSLRMLIGTFDPPSISETEPFITKGAYMSRSVRAG